MQGLGVYLFEEEEAEEVSEQELPDPNAVDWDPSDVEVDTRPRFDTAAVD